MDAFEAYQRDPEYLCSVKILKQGAYANQKNW